MAITISQHGGTPLPGQVIKSQMFLWCNDQLAISGLDFSVTAITGTGADAGEVAAQLASNLDGILVQMTAPAVRVLGWKVSQVVTSGAWLPGIAQDTVVGLAGTNSLPTQVCGIVTWLSLLAGPANRGRSYIPFPADVFQDSDMSPTGAYLTLLTNLADVWRATSGIIGAGGTTSLSPVIFSRTAITATPINDRRINDLWATQRRRGNYGIPNLPIIR